MRCIRFLSAVGMSVAVILSAVYGQEFNHSLTVRGVNAFGYVPQPDVPDTLRILAILIQFQEDDDALTTGNGRFDVSDPVTGIINPPPHDADYFQHHLEFARRYFDRVSGGKLHIEYSVWPDVFPLPGRMREYSPPRGTDFTNIGKLYEESWQAATTQAPEIPFGEFDTFVIFHAGVGRDIDLVSLYGYDPTPFDIPSLYLGMDGLRRIFGEEYEGVEVGGNGFRITNTVILPETQSRQIETVTGPLLLQLGMNGLVCAMVGSRLGLPDLFNTDTGRSGIGRFGLMDGQAIFSFFGLFPPELSAWEKYFLGWASPVEVLPGTTTFDLPAVALRQAGSTLRIPINAREYYLVENRHRNPFGMGLTLTLIQNGEEVAFVVDRDREGFNAFDISDVEGIVLDASNYDWSLPGGVTSDNIFYDGGIIIWHIDERVISEYIGSNRINSNADRKGVRVVEADGSQDIGREYTIIEPGSGSEDGTALDFWFRDNPVPIYTNTFDPNSLPAARSNTGAPVHIAAYDFSERAPVMQVTVRVGSEELSMIGGFPVMLGSLPVDSSPVWFDGKFLVIDGYQLKSVSLNGDIAGTDGDILPIPNGTPVWHETAGSALVYTRGGEQAVLRFSAPGNGQASFLLGDVFPIGETVSAGPVLLSDNSVLVGSQNGSVFKISGTAVEVTGAIPGSTIRELLIFDGSTWIAVGTRSALSSQGLTWNFPGDVSRAVGYTDATNRMAVALGDRELYRFEISSEESESLALSIRGEGEWGQPIAADINRDGQTDIVVTRGSSLYAFNLNGTLLDRFPLELNRTPSGRAYPVAADFDGDGRTDIALGNFDDQIVFMNERGDRVPGTPIAVGEKVVGSPVVFPVNNGAIGLAFVTADRMLYAYSLSGMWDPATAVWRQNRYGSSGANVQTLVYPRIPLSDEFLPADRAYNWPNPVYDGTTYIRYYLSEDADVTISLYEMNGEKVADLAGPGTGGTDNEVLWSAASVQSGIYLARIEARSASRSEVRFIKIAVVK